MALADNASAQLSISIKPCRRRGKNRGKSVSKLVRKRDERMDRHQDELGLGTEDSIPVGGLHGGLEYAKCRNTYLQQREREEAQSVSTRRVRRDIAVRAIEMSRRLQARRILGPGDPEEVSVRLEHCKQLVKRTLQEIEPYPRAWVAADLQLIDLELAGQYAA
jgi:hypothetical protein